MEKSFWKPLEFGALFMARTYLGWVVAAALVSYLTFFPGMTSRDSYVQALESVSGVYEGWHPPVMSWWWGRLNTLLWQGYSVMLAFHLCLFWGAVYVLGQTVVESSRARAYGLFALLLLPPVLGMISVIWKDTGMTASWMLACALMFRANYQQRPLSVPVFLVVLLLLFYGLAVRYNALFALPPLCYWLAASRGGMCGRFKRNALAAVGLTIGLLAANDFTTRILVKDPGFYNRMTMDRQLVSLRNISHFSGRQMNTSLIMVESLDPAFIEQLAQNPASLMAHRWERQKQSLRLNSYGFQYPQTWAKLTGSTLLPVLARDYLAHQTCAGLGGHISIQGAFAEMYLQHPFTAAAFHWSRFGDLLRVGHTTSCYPYHWNYTANESGLRARVRDYVSATKDYLWFMGWPWLLLSTALCVAAFFCKPSQRPQAVVGLVLGLSGVGYILAYLPMGPTCDFRYFYWSMMVCLITPFIYFVEIKKWALKYLHALKKKALDAVQDIS